LIESVFDTTVSGVYPLIRSGWEAIFVSIKTKK